MGVLHVAAATDNTAVSSARAAMLACRGAGISAQVILVGGGGGSDEVALQTAGEESWVASALAAIAEGDPPQPHRLSFAWQGLNAGAHPIFGPAKVIHLHGALNWLATRSIASWLAEGRRLCWSMRDAWPTTAGCHHVTDCQQWRTHCAVCPQLRTETSIVAAAFNAKRHAYGGRAGSLTIIAPSSRLAALARESALLRERPVAFIPDAVALDEYTRDPSRQVFRRALGVEAQDLLLVADVHESEDAARRLCSVIASVPALSGGARARLVLIGGDPALANACILPLPKAALAEDDVRAKLLGAADLLMPPERPDLVMLAQALSCGTPLLVRAGEAAEEFIVPGETGLVLPSDAGAQALSSLLSSLQEREISVATLRAACRATAERKYAPRLVGRQLLAVYEAAGFRQIGAPAFEVESVAGRLLSALPVRPAHGPEPEFLRFPLNHSVLRQAPPGCPTEQDRVSPPVRRPSTHRLVTLRGLEPGSPAESGAWLAALSPDRYDATHLHAEVTWPLPSKAAALARLIGPNGSHRIWPTVVEAIALCAAEPVDLLHLLDGGACGWLMASLPEAFYHIRGRPLVVATLTGRTGSQHLSLPWLSRIDAVIAGPGTDQSLLVALLGPERVLGMQHDLAQGPALAIAQAHEAIYSRLIDGGHKGKSGAHPLPGILKSP